MKFYYVTISAGASVSLLDFTNTVYGSRCGIAIITAHALHDTPTGTSAYGVVVDKDGGIFLVLGVFTYDLDGVKMPVFCTIFGSNVERTLVHAAVRAELQR